MGHVIVKAHACPSGFLETWLVLLQFGLETATSTTVRPTRLEARTRQLASVKTLAPFASNPERYARGVKGWRPRPPHSNGWAGDARCLRDVSSLSLSHVLATVGPGEREHSLGL